MAEANLWVRTSDEAEAIGPFTASQVRQIARAGLLTSQASVRQGNDGIWHPAATVKGLLPRQAPHQAETSIAGAAATRKPEQATAGPVERKGGSPAASTETEAASTAVATKRKAVVPRVIYTLLSLIVVAGLGAGSYFAVQGGAIPIPLLSPSAKSVCEASTFAMEEYATAMRARNTDAAADALRSYLNHAEKIISPDFDKQIKKLPLDDQAAIQPTVEETKIVVLALGARIGELPDTRLQAVVSQTRSMLNCVNMTGASEREHELLKETGMWKLPDDIASRATKLANALIAGASQGR
jgi:hypothetical protein